MKYLILLVFITGCASIKTPSPVLSSGSSIQVDAAANAIWQSCDPVSALTKQCGKFALEDEWVGMFCDAHHWLNVYRSGTNSDAAIQLESAIGTLQLISRQAEAKLSAFRAERLNKNKPKWSK